MRKILRQWPATPFDEEALNVDSDARDCGGVGMWIQLLGPSDSPRDEYQFQHVLQMAGPGEWRLPLDDHTAKSLLMMGVK